MIMATARDSRRESLSGSSKNDDVSRDVSNGETHSRNREYGETLKRVERNVRLRNEQLCRFTDKERVE